MATQCYVTLRSDYEERAKLLRAAKDLDTNLSGVVRTAINEWLGSMYEQGIVSCNPEQRKRRRSAAHLQQQPN